jgi:hypothetical protein
LDLLLIEEDSFLSPTFKLLLPRMFKHPQCLGGNKPSAQGKFHLLNNAYKNIGCSRQNKLNNGKKILKVIKTYCQSKFGLLTKIFNKDSLSTSIILMLDIHE